MPSVSLPFSSLPLPHACIKKTLYEHTMRWWPSTSQEKRSQIEICLDGNLDFGLPSSRTVRNEFQLFKPFSPCYFIMAAQQTKSGDWENQFPASLRRRKGSGALEKEKGIWESHGEKDKLLFLHCFVLFIITMYLARGHISP